MTMIIALKTEQQLESFKETRSYSSNPDNEKQQLIKYYEYIIKNKTEDFLHDPTYYVMKWEDLTEESLPDAYLADFPLEIDGFIIGRKGQGVKSLSMSYLPLVDEKGNKIEYPEERLVASYLKKGMKVYILKDEMMKALV